MVMRHYTRDELLHLRDSPLVQKPENLPAIEQWIEYVFADKESREKLRIPHSEPQQTHTQKRQPPTKSGAGGEASPMGNFTTGLRPSLMGSRSAGRGGDDISLGPPRTTFPSSRNVSKLSDFADKGGDGDEQDAPRSRFFGDKSNRKSLNEKGERDARESWNSARERRQMGGDDEHKEGRFGRRDRDMPDRNGHGDREGGWGARDSRRHNGERQGGWRDRERERKDRDWDRGGHAEKEPEWMDDPTPASGEDPLGSMGMARNQEEFQKWKAAMSGKKVPEEIASPEQTETTKETTAPQPAAALKLEGMVDKPFGSWGDAKPPGSSDSAAPATKSAAAKSKGSRFASMFKDQAKDDTPPAEVPAQKEEGAAEDQAGFQRILQMLGGTDISKPAPQEGPSSPPQKSTSNGTMKQKSRFTGFFDQTPKSPERMQSPPEAGEGNMFQTSRGLAEEPGSMFGGRPQDNQPSEQLGRAQAPSNPMSPEPMFPQNGNRDQQSIQPHQRGMSDLFIDQPPSRGAATPDNNIQNLLAAQRSQRSQGQDKNFLLDLLQTKGSSRPSSQQARPDNNFSLWLDQQPNMPEPHAPKPRAPPPPGLFEDQLLRNTMQEQPRQEQQPMSGNDMPHRRPSQRAPPPGFYDEQSMFLQQQQQAQQAAQRRNFTEPAQQQQQPGRRMSGHPNLPQMHIPQQHQSYPGPPPDFITSPGGHQQAPPPGFNPQMPRHPPGFQDIPSIFHAPQQQGRGPLGFPGGMPGSAGGMQSPPNAPPGFYGGPPGGSSVGMPPGFMGARSPTETMGSGSMPTIPGTNRRFEGFDGQMGVPRR